MSKPLIAIVGRPNVGKSMLFNKIIGRRLSIVEDTPGVTRDRIYGESDWNGRKFTLVDTGGIEPNTDNQILAFMRQQAQIAIDNATVIVLVTDIKTGMTAADQEVAGMLQRSKKPIVLAVNKMDSTGVTDPEFYEFYNLGLGDPIAVSAVHGHGTGDLLDACLQYFPPETDEEEDSDVVQVAIIGKPNVGKSSLTNRILGEQRVIVSNVAGTTRDAVDTLVEHEGVKYRLIDTAGMRKRTVINEDLEFYSYVRAERAIERADVALIVIDSTIGVTEQDQRVAGMAHNNGIAVVVLLNKWDLVDTAERREELENDVAERLHFVSYAPVVRISALTGRSCLRVWDAVNTADAHRRQVIPTPQLNKLLTELREFGHTVTKGTKRLKMNYITQTGNKPPIFTIFVNMPELVTPNYEHFLENRIRDRFDLTGTPIRFKFKKKAM